jgi:hypothetical protein
MNRLLFLLSFLCLSLGNASAQWLVYEVKITPTADSINFASYQAAYLVAPITGGRTSVVYLTEDNGGRYYSVAARNGRLLMAANVEARRVGFSAVTQQGTAQAMYQATGSLTTTVNYQFNGKPYTTQVADRLTGTFLMADDESELTALPADGSFGILGSATLDATLRTDLGRILNDAKTTTLEQGVASITGLLERYGYRPEEELLLTEQPTAPQGTAAQPSDYQPAEPVQPQPASAPAGADSSAAPQSSSATSSTTDSATPTASLFPQVSS